MNGLSKPMMAKLQSWINHRDKHEYLDALNGLNNPPIDKDKPLLSFTSGIIKFDVWEVVRDDVRKNAQQLKSLLENAGIDTSVDI